MPILKTQLFQQGLQFIKIVLFSQRLYAVDSSAYARRAPFVVQCRRHFRQFPRFAGELPRRGSLNLFLRYRYKPFLGVRCKHDEARIGRKDTIDLYGHCSLSSNAETKSGAADNS